MLYSQKFVLLPNAIDFNVQLLNDLFQAQNLFIESRDFSDIVFDLNVKDLNLLLELQCDDLDLLFVNLQLNEKISSLTLLACQLLLVQIDDNCESVNFDLLFMLGLSDSMLALNLPFLIDHFDIALVPLNFF